MEDYFAFMGFPRRLSLDAAELQRRYFDLSREYHPDFHTQDEEDGRQTSLEQSSVLNQAYKTLRDRTERARHLLQLEWPDLPESEKKKIPPALLMEVMEMQEKIADAGSEVDESRKAALQGDLLDIETRLKTKMGDLDGTLNLLATEWDVIADGTDDDARRNLLTRLTTLLNTRNYLRTLLATIDAAV
ncbi:MAG: Fe-S protein assembly co-chaperone HscB, partial [Bacteroidota bacterium]